MFLLKTKISYTFSILISTVLLINSCKRAETSQSYYNIDSLLNEQVVYLANSKAHLHKQATINNETQDTTFVPNDSTAWASELDIFSEIGMINKPINRGNYDIEEGHSDPASNLTVRTYQAKRNLSIVYLKLYYQDNPSKLRKVAAFYTQQNTLMKTQTRRNLTLEFTDVYEKNILTSYSIDGMQKMFVGDSVAFKITGSIQLD